MSMQDPIADMLARISNGQAAGAKEIKMPLSKLKLAIIKVLTDEGYVGSASVELDENKKILNVSLKYYQGRPVITKLKRISRPGLRVYKGCNELPSVLGGLGIAIISTPKGVMTERTARALKQGGEVLCTVE